MWVKPNVIKQQYSRDKRAVSTRYQRRPGVWRYEGKTMGIRLTSTWLVTMCTQARAQPVPGCVTSRTLRHTRQFPARPRRTCDDGVAVPADGEAQRHLGARHGAHHKAPG